MSLKLMERMPSSVLDEAKLDDSAAILARFWEEVGRTVPATRAPTSIERRPAQGAAKTVRYSYD